jgi:hypothetical protein
MPSSVNSFNIFFCDGGPPSSEYYFATDMDDSALKTYFKRASYIDQPNNLGGVSADYTFKYLTFKTTNNEEFTLTSYNNTQIVVRLFRLNPTQKQHIISIDDKYYQIAKSAL